MNLNNIVFFCYSPHQKAFHVETIVEHLKCNAAAIIQGIQPTYAVVGVYANWQEYEKNWKKLKEAILERVENTQPVLSEVTSEQILSGNF